MGISPEEIIALRILEDLKEQVDENEEISLESQIELWLEYESPDFSQYIYKLMNQFSTLL